MASNEEENIVSSTEEKINSDSYSDIISQIMMDIVSNPLNVILLCISAFLFYKIISGSRPSSGRRLDSEKESEVELPRMKKKDMTLNELKEFNGLGKTGRICIAINGRIYDVTRGKQFYGPGGSYSVFAGRDASRALALFTVSDSAFKPEYDDLSDLTLSEMNRMKEWQIQLEEKYDFVGRLLKPGEEPVDYTDSEDEEQEKTKEEKEPKVVDDQEKVSSVKPENEEESAKKEEDEHKTTKTSPQEETEDLKEKNLEKLNQKENEDNKTENITEQKTEL